MKRTMKNNLQVITAPMNMPKSVTQACSKVWSENYIESGAVFTSVKDFIPPNISDICYTYGSVCFSPRELTRDLVVHESVHVTQQGDKPDEWWDRYGDDVEFRYSQELEAYRAQYKYILSVSSRAIAFDHAKRLARDMSSHMYGSMCTFNQALQDILRK